MMRLVSILVILFSFGLHAKCKRDVDLKTKGKVIYRKWRHILTYTEDSCGVRGCEIEVFSKNVLGCYHTSLLIQGFFVKDSLKKYSVKVSKKNKVETFHFNQLKAKFEK